MSDRPEADRKYSLTKLVAGDYLLPSNDGKTLWRLRRGFNEQIADERGKIKKEFTWEVWRWTLGIVDGGRGQIPDPEDWDEWELWDGYCQTRDDAIRSALKARQ